MSSKKSECAGKNPFPWARPNKIICCLMMNKLSVFCVVPVLFSAVFHAGCTSGMSDEQARQVVRCSYETILDDGSPRSEVAVSPPWEDRRNPESVALSRTKLKAMLQGGADVNLATDDGYTPLMMAAENRLSGLVRELIARGADVKARDRFGKSALDYTRRHSLHYRVLSDGGNPLAGTVQEDSEELREVRRVLREHGGR